MVATPYESRGSHQSDFELNIEKKDMTEILLITKYDIIVHSPYFMCIELKNVLSHNIC